ncbi:MAG: IclR family transcriptional regulator [Ardenticatenaceae bacterium]
MTNVQSVERISAILNMVASQQEGAGVTEVAQQVKLPISTVSRFLLALERVDFVERVSDSSRFRIGAAIFDLATRADFAQYLIKMARPCLLELAQATGETTTLTILKNGKVYCIDQVSGQYNLQLQDWTGQYFPLHTSADGKIYLAFMPQKALNDYLSQALIKVTPHSITDPDRLREQLKEVRRTGYAWTQDEYEQGLIALASPIRGTNGQVVAAVGLGAPTFRLPADHERDQIIQQVIDSANRLTAQLQKNKININPS